MKKHAEREKKEEKKRRYIRKKKQIPTLDVLITLEYCMIEAIYLYQTMNALNTTRNCGRGYLCSTRTLAFAG